MVTTYVSNGIENILRPKPELESKEGAGSRTMPSLVAAWACANIPWRSTWSDKKYAS